MSKLLLTQAIVNDAKCEPGRKHTELCDLQVPGLMVYVSASQKSAAKYLLRAKNSKGTNEYLTIGTTSEVSLSGARKLALQLKQSRADSASIKAVSPAATAEAEMTWNTFIKEHFEPISKAHLRSAKKYMQLDRIYVAPRFGHLPLSQITRKDVQVMHVDIVEKQKMSPATADHVVKYMRAALGKSCTYGYLASSPIKNFELFMVDNQIENYLSDEQMQRLLGVLRTDKNRPVCLALMMLISTGARLNEILSATWKNVSMEGRVLKVDAVRSKSKRSRSIPLNDSAIWVLEQLQSRHNSAYLFPSPVHAKDGKDLPFSNITRARTRLFRLAGVSIRAHDLRHGFASMLVSGGRSLYEVQQILGHSDPKVTMRYAHLSSKTLQEAANAGSVIVPRVDVKAA